MKTCGFAKKEQLTAQAQYKNVYLQAAVQKNTICQMYVLNNGLDYNRLGISVTKRRCANLVMRNKIKRLIREVFRRNKQKFGQGRDIVVVLRKAPHPINYEAMERTILMLLGKST